MAYEKELFDTDTVSAAEVRAHLRDEGGQNRPLGGQGGGGGGGAGPPVSVASMGSATGNQGIGTLNYTPTQAGYGVGNLPTVSDPEATLAGVIQGQHERFIRNFRDYETALIGAKDDTSLIDQTREDAPEQERIARGVAERNRQRYGYQQTAVEARETQRESQRGGALNLAGGLNNARLAQRDINQGLLGNLFNIGQGVYQSSLGGLGEATQSQANRNMAFSNAKTAYKQQSIGFLGSLGKALASLI